jgi:hypothetical protein
MLDGRLHSINASVYTDRAPSYGRNCMKNTFIGKTIIKPYVDVENQTIELDIVEKMNEQIVNHHKEIIDIKEKIIRDALIQLGWTPPVASNNVINPTAP